MLCRVPPYRVASGPANMAIDEAMLARVARDPSAAWLRTYGWSEPTLSLGYFQPWAETEREPRWRSAARVRRATGGGAIWHEHELTFAIVVPASHPLTRPNTALYRAVHHAPGGIHKEAGAPARRHGDLEPDHAPSRPFLCFAGRDGEDLVLRGAKVLGSAQRRRAGAVLQHSSLLLHQADVVPELPGAADLAAIDPDPRAWSDRLVVALAAALDLEPVATDWPDDLLNDAARIERAVYRNPEWNHKR